MIQVVLLGISIPAQTDRIYVTFFILLGKKYTPNIETRYFTLLLLLGKEVYTQDRHEILYIEILYESIEQNVSMCGQNITIEKKSPISNSI